MEDWIKGVKCSFPRSMKKGEEETDWEVEERRQSRCIWLSGQRGLTEREAALLIIHEARSLLQDDLRQMGGELAPQRGKFSHPAQIYCGYCY